MEMTIRGPGICEKLGSVAEAPSGALVRAPSEGIANVPVGHLLGKDSPSYVLDSIRQGKRVSKLEPFGRLSGKQRELVERFGRHTRTEVCVLLIPEPYPAPLS
jgi:hypothetical protein